MCELPNISHCGYLDIGASYMLKTLLMSNGLIAMAVQFLNVSFSEIQTLNFTEFENKIL
jgi:hypothetical protein